MTPEVQKRYINYLADRVNAADLENRAMKLVLQDFLDKQKADADRLAKLDDMLSRVESLECSLKEKDRKIADLTAQLKFANKNRFGSAKYSAKKKEASPADESDRTRDEDDFDGTSSSLPENSIANREPQGAENPVAAEKKPRDLSNRPDSYNTMGVQGASKEYKSDLSKVPGRILESKMVPVFHLEVNLVEERFEMVHYVEKGKKPQWGYFPKAGNPQLVTKFDVLKDVALEKDSIVNCDETWCKVRKYDHYKKCYIWVLVNKAVRTVIFFYEDGSRGRDVLTNFIGDAELKSVMSDGYNAYVFIGDGLKSVKKSPNLQKTIHQVCLAHVKAKFDKASGLAGDRSADIFLQLIAFFYRRERQYDDEGLTPEERGNRRRDLETKEVLISLRQYLKIEKDKDPSETTPYLRAALNYLDKFWDNIFAFLKDGNLPIDNNLAGVSRGYYNMMLLAGIMEIFVRNYQRDEGRSLAIGLQEQVANHHKLRF